MTWGGGDDRDSGEKLDLLVVDGEGGRIDATRGWISVDRGSKATLPLTIPRRVFKSSAKDPVHRSIVITIQGRRRNPSAAAARHNDMGPWGFAPLLRVGYREMGNGTALLAWILT